MRKELSRREESTLDWLAQEIVDRLGEKFADLSPDDGKEASQAAWERRWEQLADRVDSYIAAINCEPLLRGGDCLAGSKTEIHQPEFEAREKLQAALDSQPAEGGPECRERAIDELLNLARVADDVGMKAELERLASIFSLPSVQQPEPQEQKRCGGCGRELPAGEDDDRTGWTFEMDGPWRCPDCNPQKSGEGEGDWPELWIQRGDPLNPETWAIWGSAENDAVPYETDGCRRYVPADTSPAPNPSLLERLAGELEETAREHEATVAVASPDMEVERDWHDGAAKATRRIAQRLREEAEGLGEEGASAITAFRAGFQYGAEEPTRDPNEAYETFLEFTHEARSQDREDQAASSAIPPDPQEGEGR